MIPIPHIYTMSTVSGLQRIIRRFLDHQIDAQDMTRILEAPIKPEPLEVTSLDLRDVQKILGLTPFVDDEFDLLRLYPSRKISVW